MWELDSASWLAKFRIRFIVPERPGFGLSDPAPRRNILDWASDVEELAGHLALDRFHVAGGSGGGPYALACALHSPKRVLSVSLFSSGGPPEVMRISEMHRGNRILFSLAKYAPFILKGLFPLIAHVIKKPRPKEGTKKAKKLARLKAKRLSRLPEWDRRALEGQNGEELRAHLKEAFRQGGDGTYRDLLLISRPWGLDLDKLTVPVFMWHGAADTNVPIASAREFSNLIPGCECHFIPDAGHMLFDDDEVRSQMMARILTVNA
ncbi:MAG TPA: alpha/beta hydrolase [Gammaproteobacteria bacterium]|nr:alpha/beta hydrolase [Gammaproteobacteria bacterium]